MKAVQAEDRPRREVSFNVGDLRPRIAEGVLTLEVPMATLSGPLVTQEMRQEMLAKCGLTPWEVDCLVDDFYDQIEQRAIMAFLAKRSKRS